MSNLKLEIAAMREANDRVDRRHPRRVMLVQQSDETWRVNDDTPDGIAPQCSYPDAAQAAARALQLLGIKSPVAPQNWPERVCIDDGLPALRRGDLSLVPSPAPRPPRES